MYIQQVCLLNSCKYGLKPKLTPFTKFYPTDFMSFGKLFMHSHHQWCLFSVSSQAFSLYTQGTGKV